MQINEILVRTETDFEVHEDNLDLDLSRQGKLLCFYGEQAASFEALAKNAKAELDRVYAHADLEIRADAANAKDRITESQVKSKITVRIDYQEAMTNYIDAQKNADTVENLWRAMNGKTGLIRTLSDRQRAVAFAPRDY